MSPYSLLKWVGEGAKVRQACQLDTLVTLTGHAATEYSSGVPSLLGKGTKIWGRTKVPGGQKFGLRLYLLLLSDEASRVPLGPIQARRFGPEFHSTDYRSFFPFFANGGPSVFLSCFAISLRDDISDMIFFRDLAALKPVRKRPPIRSKPLNGYG